MKSCFNYLYDFKKSISFRHEVPNTISSCMKRVNNKIEYLIDGEQAFLEIAEGIYNSKESIEVMDWRLDFDLIMVRKEHYLKGKTVLDLFKIAASNGVVIRIILYKSPTFSRFSHNKTTTKILNRAHPNIHCIRKRWSMLFSHHEKLMIIDQSVGFMGGIDVCGGRFDNSQHYISPLIKRQKISLFPQNDYNNIQLKHTTRYTHPRMPWHDVHCKVQGQILMDLITHFNQRWEFYGGKMTPIKYIESDGTMQMQMFRSVCKSSGGRLESSIYGEIIRLIRKSKRFIYIEQQYFFN
ncbi:phospholipase D [Entamoeba marina]